MKETGAPLAGEMSGHIFFKHRWYGFDDALYAAVRLIEAVSASGKSLTAIMDAMPKSVRHARAPLPGRRAPQVRHRRGSPRPPVGRRRQGRRHRRRPRQHIRRLVAASRIEHAGRAGGAGGGEGRARPRSARRSDRRAAGEIRRREGRSGSLTSGARAFCRELHMAVAETARCAAHIRRRASRAPGVQPRIFAASALLTFHLLSVEEVIEIHVAAPLARHLGRSCERPMAVSLVHERAEPRLRQPSALRCGIAERLPRHRGTIRTGEGRDGAPMARRGSASMSFWAP